jgi:hypothetical protein
MKSKKKALNSNNPKLSPKKEIQAKKSRPEITKSTSKELEDSELELVNFHNKIPKEEIEAVNRMGEMVLRMMKSEQNKASEQNQMYDLQNLPFDPAEEAVKEAYKLQKNESGKLKVPPFRIAQADDPIYRSGLIISAPVSRGLTKNSSINIGGEEQQQDLVSIYDPKITTDPKGEAQKDTDRLEREAKKTKMKANALKKSLKEKLFQMEPKREEFKDEESYLEARDFFRHRAGFLLRPKK